MTPPDDRMDENATRSFFGGSRSISRSTLYRGMEEGRYPRPINVGGNRWLRTECEAAVQRMIEKRDDCARRRQLVTATA